MNVHEYQAKELLKGYGVAVPRGAPAFGVDEAVAAARALGGGVWVVKSQIHAGGRGAGRFADDPDGAAGADGAGGVRLARSPDEVAAHAGAMLGRVLVTKQTGPAGRTVRRLYVEEGCDIARELYLGLLVDRGTGRVVAMASTEGGMDIEQVAAQTPEKIVTVAIDPATGFQPFHGRRIAFGLGLSGAAVRAAADLAAGLYRAFTELDANVVEVNPLVLTGGGEVVALDAKMSFDDNALYRHPALGELRDEDEEDPAELEAGRHELNYVALDGEIGCMVNGAGLAMATMDLIKLHGSEPANFLDVGGNATRERVSAAFRIILSDPKVKGVLVNIFGGIMRCDVVAEGVVAAARDVELAVPLVVRLEGTNVDEGRAILAGSGLPIVSGDGLDDAARKVVEAVRQGQGKGKGGNG